MRNHFTETASSPSPPQHGLRLRCEHVLGLTPMVGESRALGGQDAQIVSVTGAAGQVAGIVQVTVMIPDESDVTAPSPIVISAGGVPSQGAVTIAVATEP